MARYIDADDLISFFIDYGGVTTYGKDTVRAIVSRINAMPTADVAEVKHGKWLPIVKQDNYLDPPYCDTIKCSECGEEADVSFHDAKYCYMCGAKMDGGKAE